MAPVCRIVSSDYLDKDVFLNIRCFYAAAGYRIAGPGAAAELLVVLRGDNGTAERAFSGVIHVYDYVREYRIDWRQRYPHATRILVIALEPRPAAAGPLPAMRQAPRAEPSDGVERIDAFLPVMAALWAEPWRHKQSRPLHLSNYKRMPGDAYQEDLLGLIRSGAVQVHGGRWDLVGIEARPLSYRQANRRLAEVASCFGLMWPYQRGQTLSGRMWQAPLNGCFVISESGTDILGCPGVLERQRFDRESAALHLSAERCRELQRQAIRFWEAHTDALAVALGFPAGLRASRALIQRHRLQLLLWDLQFRVELGRDQLAGWLGRVRSALSRRARRLGLRPGQGGERR